MSLGFLVSLKNAERGILPQYGSLLHLFPYAKSPTTTAPPLCSGPGLLHLLTPAVYFPSQAIPLDASNQTQHPSSCFHVSALHLTSQGAWFPISSQHFLQKDLLNILSLLFFAPCSFPLVLSITVIMKQTCSMKTVNQCFGLKFC